MYCPGCGKIFIRIGDYLTCIEGKMALSQRLERRLTDCYVLRVDEHTSARLSFKVGGELYCPGCGAPTVEDDGFVRCVDCGLSLNEFIYELFELHPHKKPGDTSDWEKRN